MALAPSTRIGPYEILALIGAGGMGEVYRARDTRLGRDLAIKVLPDIFARNKERMARFEREARVLASLNHPNIATIHGVEESGSARALVMELAEGPTLAERVKNGAIPIEEALPVAKQIAEALEYAHERGVIHRDLKPANVKIAADGRVKLLDFGLAKALEGDGEAEQIENSPTLSAVATQGGLLLGTAAYMSPEQARGKKVDRRADIWAFGVVLYEMLTGKRLFSGETISDTLAAVIRAEPDWTTLTASTPQTIRELLRRCLQKDPRQRLQAIGDARIAIEQVLSGASEDTRVALPASLRNSRRERIAWGVVCVLAIAFLLAIIGYFARAPHPVKPMISQIDPPENTNFVQAGASAGPPVLSPNGESLAFAANGSDGRTILWVRHLSAAAAQPLDGTDGATFPFWSPDSRSIGYFANGKLSRIDASGGPALTICDAVTGRGGSWGSDGTILFALLTGPIFRVPVSGGAPEPVTNPNETSNHRSHRWPQFLPDGRHFLFFDQGPMAASSEVYAGSLAGGKPKLLFRNSSNAVYVSPGYLLYVRQGALLAQQFDLRKLQLIGDGIPLVKRDAVDSTMYRGEFTASENGVLAYAGGSSNESRLVWFDRNGKQLAESGTPNVYGFPRISPDGRKVAVFIQSGSNSSGIWVLELQRGLSTRLTFDSGRSAVPVWSPDGKSIAYLLTQGTKRDIYEKPADGTGNATPLVVGDADHMFPSWSFDERYLIYQRRAQLGNSQWEIWAEPLFGDRKAFPVLQNPQFLEGDPALSPDGRWLAHDSDESGRFEVYLTPFLHGGGKWQVSTGGGGCPRWRADGRELFYVSPDNKIMSAQVSEQGSGVVIGTVHALFQADPVPSAPECMYDVTPDGKKFLVVTPAKHRGESLTLVVNWPALLKKPGQQ